MTYPDEPLPSETCIRVLTISKYNVRQVEIRSNVVDLCQKPCYRCLSYTWGGPRYCDVEDSWMKPVQSVVFNNSIFNLRQNLYDALLHLLENGETGPIWIDALSINQTDNSERNSQVSQMAQIYEDAEKVIVWLGMEDTNTSVAISSMRKLNANIDQILFHFENGSIIDGLLEDQAAEAQYTMDELLAAINFMTTYQWFSRIWTVQETYLARKIDFLCSSKVMELETVIKGSLLCHFCNVTNAWERLRKTREYQWALQFTTDLRGLLIGRGQTGRPSVGALAVTHRRRRATDPRDKVFAVAGISDLRNERLPGLPIDWVPGVSSKCVPEPFQIDYNQTIQRVFSNAALEVLVVNQCITALSDVGDMDARRTPELPSWVPDYTCDLVPESRIAHEREFCAVPGFPAIACNTSNPFAVCLRGYHLDSITSVCNPFWEPEHISSILELLQLVLDPVPVVSLHRASLATILERTLVADSYIHYWSTGLPGNSYGFQRWLFSQVYKVVAQRNHDIALALIRDPEPSLEPALHAIGLAEHLEILTEPMLQGARQCPSQEAVHNGLLGVSHDVDPALAKFVDLQSAPQSYRFHGSWERMCRHRKLFRTRGGYIGLALSRVQPGDRIYLLQGAEVPYVLRCASIDSESTLVLEGEAYVDGIMYGEAVPKDKSEFQKILVV